MLDEKGAPVAKPDPSVSFGGKTYTMRVGTLCAYLLSEMKVDAGAIWAVSDRERRITSFAHIIQLFRATIAHNFTAAKAPVPSAEELALMLDNEPSELFADITSKTLNLVYPNLMALANQVRLQEPEPATADPKPN